MFCFFHFILYLFQNNANISLQSSARTRNLKVWSIIKVFFLTQEFNYLGRMINRIIFIYR